MDFIADAILRNEKMVYLLYRGSGPGLENGLMTLEVPPGSEARLQRSGFCVMKM